MILKQQLVASLSLLPPNVLVGLVTFGTVVHLHELCFSELPKSFVFRGNKDYPQKLVQDLLGLVPSSQNRPPGSDAAAQK